MNEQLKWGKGGASELHERKRHIFETEKKEFCLFYIRELLNVIYTTYKSTKPVYTHFICSKKNDYDHLKNNNLVYYTPNSMLEQHFPDYFQNVYFLCAHYTMREREGNVMIDSSMDYMKIRKTMDNVSTGSTMDKLRNVKSAYNADSVSRININSSMERDKNKNGQKSKDTFYFIFTFYMEPNFIWEEVNIPIFHERGYIECKFDSVDNLMKLNNVVNLSEKLKRHTYNKTLIQHIRELSSRSTRIDNKNIVSSIVNQDDNYNSNSNNSINKNNNSNCNSTRNGNSDSNNANSRSTRKSTENGRTTYDTNKGPRETPDSVHLLPFFISSDYLHKNSTICKTRVISFNERDIYCKIDEGDSFPKQILLLVRKKLYNKLKFMEMHTAKGGTTMKEVIQGRDTTIKEALPGGTSMKEVVPEDTLIKEAVRRNTTSTGIMKNEGKEQYRNISLNKKGHQQNVKNKDNCTGLNYTKIQRIINSTDMIFKKAYSDQQLEYLLMQSREKSLTRYIPSTTYFTNDKVINMHLELDEYYKFFQKGKNQFKNTLQDPWQLGIGRRKTQDGKKFYE
ncbi:conserved Plasmodium protein, unknown function [Plasmodium malariae]|uniref:Uncharacterized protein n=1 Tax=Plasmodium malariae TaxID=5858 RepID=A0A1C3L2Y9_PLAMA|nr:conserved Plasmodium protein, unknown function [Plasmodium malariae]